MKKVLFIIGLAFLLEFASAQPIGNRGPGHGNASLIITSQNFEQFWLYINDKLQNMQPTSSICVSGLRADTYDIAIVMSNNESAMEVSLNPQNNNFLIDYTPRGNKIFLKHVNFNILADETINYLPNGVPNWGQNSNPSPNHGHGHGQGGHHPVPQSQNNPTPLPPPQQQPVIVEMPVPEPAPAMPVPQACSPEKFSQIKNMVSQQAFEDDKMGVAKQATRNTFLSVNQIIEIAKLFSFEDNRLDYLKFAYDHCFDRENYYLANSVLTYKSSKEELNDFLLNK
ncbi:MAG: DUF4476 domain-containing protein [Bacteroidales bacterium]|nr:DUF4476 domain-containing protein [Bacteroidales bacterium]